MWNPFKKQEAAPQDNPVVQAVTLLEGTPRLMLLGSSRTFDELPQNEELLAALTTTPRTPTSNYEALWNTLLDGELWVPVFDADLESAENRAVNAMVFQQDTAFYAFTDAERLRAFFKDAMPVQSDTLNVALVDGRTICDMAAKFDVQTLFVNPNFAEEWELPPLVFRILARNIVPGSLGAPIPHGEANFMLPIAGLPPEPALGALREVLRQNNARAAFWLINFWEQPSGYAEMRYSLAVDCEAEQFLDLESQLALTWSRAAPFPAALLSLPLRELGELQPFVRERCAPLFP